MTSLSTVPVAQWIRRGHRVVQNGGSNPGGDHTMVQVEASSPGGDIYQIFFSNDFYFTFVRPNSLQ